MATVNLKDIIRTRPVRPEDHDFLFELYASTRQDVWALIDWSEQRKLDFVRSQFNAQRIDYTRRFPADTFKIILEGDVPVGRLYLHRGETEIRVVDIIVARSHRGRGIARHLMRQILDEADTRGVPVRLHVQPANFAAAWYERLGFETIAQAEYSNELQRNPAGHGAPVCNS